MIGLWRYNQITGLWVLARSCEPDTADEWLRRWQRDEPNEIFKLSKNKPSKAPPGHNYYGADMADRQTMHDFVRKHGVSMTCSRAASNPAMEHDARYPMDHWRCTLRCGGRSALITFSMGEGHKGRKPEVEEVLNAMASDASSAENSEGWEDFAREMGMEPYVEDDYGRQKPNPKAKKTYAACIKEGEQLRRLLGEEAAQELMYETEGL